MKFNSSNIIKKIDKIIIDGVSLDGLSEFMRGDKKNICFFSKSYCIIGYAIELKKKGMFKIILYY